MNINELEELAKAQPKGRVKSDYLAAANPSAILELISAYREAVDAIRNTLNGVDTSRRDCRSALATAKRLGIDQL